MGYGTPSDPVLMSARMTHFTKRRAAELFRKAAKNSGLGNVLPHDCRHSYGSLMIEKGKPITRVSRWLGHANPSITMRIYADVVEGLEHNDQALVDEVFSGHAVTTAESGDPGSDHGPTYFETRA